jgi:hypothetical protein
MCAGRRVRLTAPYAPALIPPLLAAGLYERVMSEAGAQPADQDDQDDQDDGRESREDTTAYPPVPPDGDRPAGEDRKRRRMRRAVMAGAAAVVIGGGSAAAVAGILPGFQRVPLRITVITNVAAVTDIPGDPAGPCTADTQALRTDCTKVFAIAKGRSTPIAVVPPPGSEITLWYFGCDDRSPAGSPICTVTSETERTICITTTAVPDRPNVAECRNRTS